MVILALHLGPIWLVCFIIIIVIIITIIGINIIVVTIIMLIIQGVRFLPHKIKRALSSTSTPHLSMVIIIITRLISLPPALLTLASVGILLPSSGQVLNLIIAIIFIATIYIESS